MIERLLNQLEPDGDVLLQAISSYVTDEMLDWIAGADYGDRREEHYQALLQVRESGNFPNDLAWVPMEVLELIRWSEPEDPTWKPGGPGEFGHWMRAFSCAAILRAEHEPWNYRYNDGSSDSTTIQLVLSLDALEINLNREAARCFAWLLLKSDPGGQNDSIRGYGVALLWFALRLKPVLADADLTALAQWVMRRADELECNPQLKEFSGCLKAMRIACQKRSAWEMLGVKLAELDLRERLPDLQTSLKLIAEELVN